MLLTCMISLGYSQYYYLPVLNAEQNPENLNNDGESTVGNGLPEDWVVLLGPAVSTPTWTDVQTIPFDFMFNEELVSEYIVSTSGILSFTTDASSVPSTDNENLPSSSIPDKSICVWGISGHGANDHIVSKTFGESPNRQHWVFFNSYSIPGIDGWSYWSIVIEETTNKIYIVDMRTDATVQLNLTLGIQIDQSTAIEVDGSPNIDNLSQESASAADNIYYEFILGTQAEYDMFTYGINSENFYNLSEAPFTIGAEFKNFGTTTITNYDLNYQINGGDIITESLSDKNIVKFGTDYIDFTAPFNPETVGAYEIVCWASNLNGNEDEIPENDQLSRSVSVVNNPGPILPLHEVFTSSTCGPCVGGNENLKVIFNANPNEFTCIKYQMSWPAPGDIYYTEEGGVRRTFYGVSAVPNMFVNGGFDNIAPYNYTQDAFNGFQDAPAYMEIHGNHIITGTSIKVDMAITPNQNYPWDDVTAFMVVLERITTENVGSNGETEFEYVMMKMLPDANGIQLSSLIPGQTVYLSETADLVDTNIEEYDDLEVVLFVQRKSTHEMFQSAWSGETSVGTDHLESNIHINIYPNPASDHIRIEQVENSEIIISASNGQIVNQSYSTSNVFNFNCSKLNNGIYFVTIKNDNQTTNKKFIINR